MPLNSHIVKIKYQIDNYIHLRIIVDNYFKQNNFEKKLIVIVESIYFVIFLRHNKISILLFKILN